jgi:hypothetical protein
MRRFPTLFVAIALVVAACNGSVGDEATTSAGPATTVGDAGTTEGDTPTTAGGETTTTAAPEASTTTPPPATGGGPDCLVGTWVLDSEAFVGALTDLFAETGLDAQSLEANEGTYTVEMDADGTFTGIRDEWGLSIALDEGTFDIVINGTETGTWTADESTLTVSDTESDVSVSASVQVGGQVQEIPESPVDVPEAIASDSEYSCDADTLTVTSEGVTTVMNRA